MSNVTDYLNFGVDFASPDIVAVYDELSLWSATFGLLLLKYIPLQLGTDVLDIGCGTGFPLLELAQRLGPQSMVYGIDHWEAAIERAKLKAQMWNVHNVDIRHDNAEAMPFADEKFDFIVANLGINNFNDPEATLRECWRVSKRSGKVVLTTNLKGHMQEFYDVFEAILLEDKNKKAVDALKLHIDSRATIGGIATLFERTGFRLSKVHEEAIGMRFADGSAFLRHYFVKIAFLDGWKNVMDIGEQEDIFSRLEASLNDLAKRTGGLNLTIPMAYIEGERVNRVW